MSKGLDKYSFNWGSSDYYMDVLWFYELLNLLLKFSREMSLSGKVCLQKVKPCKICCRKGILEMLKYDL